MADTLLYSDYFDTVYTAKSSRENCIGSAVLKLAVLVAAAQGSRVRLPLLHAVDSTMLLSSVDDSLAIRDLIQINAIEFAAPMGIPQYGKSPKEAAELRLRDDSDFVFSSRARLAVKELRQEALKVLREYGQGGRRGSTGDASVDSWIECVVAYDRLLKDGKTELRALKKRTSGERIARIVRSDVVRVWGAGLERDDRRELISAVRSLTSLPQAQLDNRSFLIREYLEKGEYSLAVHGLLKEKLFDHQYNLSMADELGCRILQTSVPPDRITQSSEPGREDEVTEICIVRQSPHWQELASPLSWRDVYRGVESIGKANGKAKHNALRDSIFDAVIQCDFAGPGAYGRPDNVTKETDKQAMAVAVTGASVVGGLVHTALAIDLHPLLLVMGAILGAPLVAVAGRKAATLLKDRADRNHERRRADIDQKLLSVVADVNSA